MTHILKSTLHWYWAGALGVRSEQIHTGERDLSSQCFSHNTQDYEHTASSQTTCSNARESERDASEGEWARERVITASQQRLAS
jgi:hypothetical protein